MLSIDMEHILIIIGEPQKIFQQIKQVCATRGNKNNNFKLYLAIKNRLPGVPEKN